MFKPKELTGTAFRSASFVDYVARVAAWRDKMIADADVRMAKRLDLLENEYMAARHRTCLNFKEDVRKAFEEFERRQEATQRNVEQLLENDKEVPTGRALAKFHGPHVNDHYETTIK